MDNYSSIVDLVGNVGALSFVFMLVWRTTHHTIPKLAKGFEDAAKEARNDFQTMLQQQRNDFNEILREHRKFVVHLGNIAKER